VTNFRYGLILYFFIASFGANGAGFYLIVHMTNTPATVQWAVDQGANGLEMDLQFDSAGSPTVFQHGGSVTDCVCAFAYGICPHYDGDPKTRSTPAGQHLDNIATKPSIALVVIDSKINGSDPTAKQTAAGKAVVKLLEDHLFGNSFSGQAIVSVASTSAAAYLSSVSTAAAASTYKNRIHFTFDQEGSDVAKSLNTLKALSNSNRVYGTGISACSPTQYYQAIEQAVRNRNVPSARPGWHHHQ
jgi:hypothetical protein